MRASTREGAGYASLWASRLGSSRLGSRESSSASEHWSDLQAGHAQTSALWQNESPGEGEESLLCRPVQVSLFEGCAPPFSFCFSLFEGEGREAEDEADLALSSLGAVPLAFPSALPLTFDEGDTFPLEEDLLESVLEGVLSS